MKSAADVIAHAESGTQWASTINLIEELGARAVTASATAPASREALDLFRREVFEFTDMLRQAEDLLSVYPPLVDRMLYAEFLDGWLASVTTAAREVAEGLAV